MLKHTPAASQMRTGLVAQCDVTRNGKAQLPFLGTLSSWVKNPGFPRGPVRVLPAVCGRQVLDMKVSAPWRARRRLNDDEGKRWRRSHSSRASAAVSSSDRSGLIIS
jgi:hypothetical protein